MEGKLIRNRVTPEGHELGKLLAKFCDEAEPVARLVAPDLPPRCQSCAFREGRHLANGSPATTMDAVKAVIEGVEFYCHQQVVGEDRSEHLCSGWAMMMLAKDRPDFGECPWPFSDEPDQGGRDEG